MEEAHLVVEVDLQDFKILLLQEVEEEEAVGVVAFHPLVAVAVVAEEFQVVEEFHFDFIIILILIILINLLVILNWVYYLVILFLVSNLTSFLIFIV